MEDGTLLSHLLDCPELEELEDLQVGISLFFLKNSVGGEPSLFPTLLQVYSNHSYPHLKRLELSSIHFSFCLRSRLVHADYL